MRHVTRLRTSLLLLATALLFLSPRARGQEDAFSALASVADAELRGTRTPGAAVALVRNDRVVYARGFGVANVETREPVSPEMLFRLGSTTKMFTAAAAALVAEDGKLKFDERIGRVVPDLHPSIARLTLHQLLTHTAGLNDAAPMFGRHDEEALGDEVRKLTDADCFTDPGQIYSYSNRGFWIAGFVAAQADGKLYADLVGDRLFKPLGMTRSTFRPTMAMTYALAQGHEAEGGKPPSIIRPAANNAGGWPAGSMFSSVLDLSRFVIAFMNDGRLDGSQVLSPSVIALLSGTHAVVPGREPSHYGYGLNTSVRRGHRFVQHGGSRAGYGSSIRMAPDDKVAVIVLANRSGSGMPKTTTRAMELLLGLGEETDTAETTQSLTASELGDLPGRYAQRADDAIELIARSGALFVKSGARELAMRKVGAWRYEVSSAPDGQPSTLIVTPGHDGKPLYLHRGGRAFKRAAVRQTSSQDM
jgi:CubicO group peptidase (beta-lactamase class C family)